MFMLYLSIKDRSGFTPKMVHGIAAVSVELPHPVSMPFLTISSVPACRLGRNSARTEKRDIWRFESPRRMQVPGLGADYLQRFHNGARGPVTTTALARRTDLSADTCGLSYPSAVAAAWTSDLTPQNCTPASGSSRDAWMTLEGPVEGGMAAWPWASKRESCGLSQPTSDRNLGGGTTTAAPGGLSRFRQRGIPLLRGDWAFSWVQTHLRYQRRQLSCPSERFRRRSKECSCKAKRENTREQKVCYVTSVFIQRWNKQIYYSFS